MQTFPGEKLVVVGNLEVLGNWSTDGGLELASADNETWTGQVVLPESAKHKVSFKFVKVSDDGYASEWEVCSLHALILGHSTTAHAHAYLLCGHRCACSGHQLLGVRAFASPNNKRNAGYS